MDVVVLEPLPCFRRGLVAALLDAHFDPWEPPDLDSWVRSDQDGAVVVALVSDKEAKWLRRFRDTAPTKPALALLPDVSVEGYRRAMRSGATSAVGRDLTPEEIVESLSLACAGHAVIPARIAFELAMTADVADHPSLSATEVGWLAVLYRGYTVAELARQSGYSEREMFRRLHDLYVSMGVRSKTEALLAAQRWALV